LGGPVAPCLTMFPLPSSPHLVQVRERIRINGQPISKELFTKYFWLVYNRLEETKVGAWGLWGCSLPRDPRLGWGYPMPSPYARPARQDPVHASMPAYFRFLTIMAFHVFLQEKVGGRGGLQLVMGMWGWWEHRGGGDLGSSPCLGQNLHWWMVPPPVGRVFRHRFEGQWAGTRAHPCPPIHGDTCCCGDSGVPRWTWRWWRWALAAPTTAPTSSGRSWWG